MNPKVKLVLAIAHIHNISARVSWYSFPNLWSSSSKLTLANWTRKAKKHHWKQNATQFAFNWAHWLLRFIPVFHKLPESIASTENCFKLCPSKTICVCRHISSSSDLFFSIRSFILLDFSLSSLSTSDSTYRWGLNKFMRERTRVRCQYLGTNTYMAYEVNWKAVWLSNFMLWSSDHGSHIVKHALLIWRSVHQVP